MIIKQKTAASLALSYLQHFSLTEHADPYLLLTPLPQPGSSFLNETQAAEQSRTIPKFRKPLVELLVELDECQISSWRRPPLRSEQIQYAALDAHCLIKVHDTSFVSVIPEI